MGEMSDNVSFCAHITCVHNLGPSEINKPGKGGLISEGFEDNSFTIFKAVLNQFFFRFGVPSILL